MNKDRIAYIIQAFRSNSLTTKEWDELNELLKEENSGTLRAYLMDLLERQPGTVKVTLSANDEAILQNILNSDRKDPASIVTKSISGEQKPSSKSRMLFRWTAAAAILLAVVGGWLIWQNISEQTANLTAKENIGEAFKIKAPQQGAVLTLSDGTKVLLDTVNDGFRTSEHSTDLQWEDGELRYGSASQTAGTRGATAYNTLETPAGRQFRIQLPDGSKVWLNAMSSIRYPVAFTGKTRAVELKGEAYLEVAKDPRRGFIVSTETGLQLDVLGTAFNVNGYSSEKEVKVTLVEGSLLVKAQAAQNNNAVKIKPGEQATVAQTANGKINPTSKISVDRSVDMEQVLAWKNGRFNFEGMKLRQVMKQLERWYDVTVVYEDGVPDTEFYGELSRDNSLGDILLAFKDAELKYKLEGRKLTIMK
ncbi:FecR family protein [Pseudoflavitalea rhizosphaerae]|uniref:FecR family protein n=1 Tax=Pseudoflavitalea rhizosphaerae TaxID=1884793 RepID=UPI000F8F1F01|nr:FecR family protein [Pseudoflavitalea rhizosphaerae]